MEGSKFCKGGDKAGDESCEIGHKGLLCQECWDDYYYDGTLEKCVVCESGHLHVGGIILISVLGASVVAFVVYNILKLVKSDLLQNVDFSISTLLYLFYMKYFASRDNTGEIEFKEKYLELYERFSIKFKISTLAAFSL
jgi:hypothetical protein